MLILGLKGLISVQVILRLLCKHSFGSSCSLSRLFYINAKMFEWEKNSSHSDSVEQDLINGVNWGECSIRMC